MNYDSDLDKVLTIVAPLMALVTLAMTLFGFSPLGGMKIFRFMLGMFAVVTALVFTASFSRGNKWNLIGLTCWMVIATINFSQAIWLAH